MTNRTLRPRNVRIILTFGEFSITKKTLNPKTPKTHTEGLQLDFFFSFYSVTAFASLPLSLLYFTHIVLINILFPFFFFFLIPIPRPSIYTSQNFVEVLIFIIV